MGKWEQTGAQKRGRGQKYVLKFVVAADTPSSSRAVELRPGLSIANDAEPG